MSSLLNGHEQVLGGANVEEEYFINDYASVSLFVVFLFVFLFQ
jgi:hypothetical protein